MPIQRKYRLYNGQKVYDYHLNDELNQLVNKHNELYLKIYEHCYSDAFPHVVITGNQVFGTIPTNKLKASLFPASVLITPYLVDLIQVVANDLPSGFRKFVFWPTYCGVSLDQSQYVPEFKTFHATRIKTTGGNTTLKLESPSINNPNRDCYILKVKVKNNGPTFKINDVLVENNEIKTILIETNASNVKFSVYASVHTDNLDFYAYAPEIILKKYFIDYEECEFQPFDSYLKSLYINFPYPIVFSEMGDFLDTTKWTTTGAVNSNGESIAIGITTNNINELYSVPNIPLNLGSKLVIEWAGSLVNTVLNYHYFGFDKFNFKYKWEDPTKVYANVNGLEVALDGLYTKLNYIFKIEITANTVTFFINNVQKLQTSHNYTGDVKVYMRTYDANKIAYIDWLRVYYIP